MVRCLEKEPSASGALPSAPALSDVVLLTIGKGRYTVSSRLKEGYLAACKAYANMEQQEENGPYFFLTGSEYTRLARQFMPAQLSRLEKHEWHRGFVAGWNVCTFGIDER
jgi:hypothetical protein